MKAIEIDDWSRGCQDFTQIYQAAFKLPWNLWAWTKLYTRMVKKAAERTLIKFFFLAFCQSNASFFFRTQFQMESNHYEMKLHFQISSFSLNVSQLCWQNVFSPFLWPLKLCFKIFLKRFLWICSNFPIIEATKGGTSSFKRFLNSRCREIQRQVKNVMASLRCHGNSDVNETRVRTDFHLYIVQL